MTVANLRLMWAFDAMFLGYVTSCVAITHLSVMTSVLNFMQLFKSDRLNVGFS